MEEWKSFADSGKWRRLNSLEECGRERNVERVSGVMKGSRRME